MFGFLLFAGESKSRDTALILSLVLFAGVTAITCQLATKNGVWGFDSVLDFGSTEKIGAQGWEGIGAYPLLFATYDYPILGILTSAVQSQSMITLDELYVLIPVLLVVASAILLISLMKRILPLKLSLVASLVIIIYPGFFGNSYVLQTLATCLMLTVLLCLMIGDRNPIALKKCAFLVVTILPVLLLSHVLEPYVLVVLAVYVLFYEVICHWQSQETNGTRLGPPKKRDVLIISKPVLAIVVVLIVVVFSIMVNPALFSRFTGVLFQIYGEQPLGRQVYQISQLTSFSVLLDIGEYVMIALFLFLGLFDLHLVRVRDDRKDHIMLYFPLVLICSTELLTVFRSMYVHVARLFIWAWILLIPFAVGRSRSYNISRYVWTVLILVLLVWECGTVAKSEAFDSHHRYDFSRGEYKPYLTDAEINAARWFGSTPGSVLGDQGAWHLLAAYSDASVDVNISAFRLGVVGIDRYDWFFLRYENQNLSFDAYGGDYTSFTVEQHRDLDSSDTVARIFDNGGVMVYKVVVRG
jgi:hypothetical protein